jgi:hypothetical protein
VPPATPGAAHEADKAKAGTEVKYSAAGLNPAPVPASANPPVSEMPRFNPNPSPEPAEKPKTPHYIEIELLDDEKVPMAGEPYEIILPDGSTLASGTLNDKGRARVDGIDPGTCRVRFPKRDQSAVRRR